MRLPTPKQFLIILIASFVLVVATVGIYVSTVLEDRLPSIAQLDDPPQERASQIFSADGKQIALFATERRIKLKKQDIPDHFFNALIATEDRSFYEHWGVHLERIGKAAFKNVFQGRREGGSTITQQLAGNLFTGRERSLERKIREAFTAVKIEETYTKDQILTMYANTVNFGSGNYGIQMASRSFFNKEPKDLTVAESAYLVAKVKAPSTYDARFNYDKALNRRNLVLRLMKDTGYLTAGEYEVYRTEDLKHTEGDPDEPIAGIAPHFVEDIRQELNDSKALSEYDLYGDGLKIYTTLDATMQKHALLAVKEHLDIFQEKIDKRFNWKYKTKLLESIVSKGIRESDDYRQAKTDADKAKVSDRLRKSDRFIDSLKNLATTIQIGMVVMDSKSGQIKAMVGASPKFMASNKYARYSLNHVSGINRQPGSVVKPFVYASALQQGLNPDDEVECGPFVYTDPSSGQVWAPRTGTNDCNEEGAKMSLRTGLRRSVNSVAARLITQYTNPGEVVKLLKKSGVKSRIAAVPALALGAGGEMSPMEVTEAFNVFANNGYHVEPYYIDKIRDEDGLLIFDRTKIMGMNEAVGKDVANDMTFMLQGVVDGGTGGRVRTYFKGVDAAGKTGTTNDAADAWFVGYTPELICGIWVGFDDQRVNFESLGWDAQGGRAAAPIWGKFMNRVYNDKSLTYKEKSFKLDNPLEIPSEEDFIDEGEVLE
ncbi:MAG: PBP1A family penicillin-binding protein [Candidatus Kapaibacteriales bacterium]